MRNLKYIIKIIFIAFVSLHVHQKTLAAEEKLTPSELSHSYNFRKYGPPNIKCADVVSAHKSSRNPSGIYINKSEKNVLPNAIKYIQGFYVGASYPEVMEEKNNYLESLTELVNAFSKQCASSRDSHIYDALMKSLEKGGPVISYKSIPGYNYTCADYKEINISHMISIPDIWPDEIYNNPVMSESEYLHAMSMAFFFEGMFNASAGSMYSGYGQQVIDACNASGDDVQIIDVLRRLNSR